MGNVKQGRWARKNPLVKTKNPKVLRKLAMALAIVLVATVAYIGYLQPHTLEAKQALKLQSTEQQLLQTKKQLEQQQVQTKAQEQQRQQEIQQLNQQLQAAQKQLAARRAAAATAQALAAEVPAGYTITQGCGDNAYANYIYMHESGCRTNAFGSLTNLGRACGIGQALPCSKLPCALDDYRCQNTWFTNYAIARYGSWYNAYIYWTNHKDW